MKKTISSFGVVVLGQIATIAQAFALVKFYGWFFKDTFSLPNIGYAQMFGFLCAIGLLQIIFFKQKESSPEDVIERIFVQVLACLMMTGIGYIAHLFV